MPGGRRTPTGSLVDTMSMSEKFNLWVRLDLRALLERRRASGSKAARVLPATLGMVGFAMLNRSDSDGTVVLVSDRACGRELLALESYTDPRTLIRALKVLEEEGIITQTYGGRPRFVWARLRELKEARTETERKATDCHAAGDNLTPEVVTDCHESTTGCPEAATDCHPKSDKLSSPPIEDRARRSPTSQHPPPPRVREADPGGGGWAVELRPNERERAVLDAYPGPNGTRPHPEAVEHLDIAALRTALGHESSPLVGADPPVTLDEILAATMKYAASNPSHPLRPRKWFAERGYMDFVRQIRFRELKAGKLRQATRTFHQPETPGPTMAEQAEEAAATIDRYGPATLESLRDQVCATMGAQSPVRINFAKQDPADRKNLMLRLAIADLVRSGNAVFPAEGAAA